MKKRSVSFLVVVTLASSILFSSCIGSFSLTNKLLSWNKRIDSKFVNELVFVAFHIVPVYGVSILADILVLNSIEFWSGTNPVADVGTVKTIEATDGVYTVETKADGYSIQKEGEEAVVDLNFDKAEQSWSIEANGESHKLLKFTDNDEVVMYLPDGQEMTVSADAAGVLAFKQVATNYSFYAAK